MANAPSQSQGFAAWFHPLRDLHALVRTWRGRFILAFLLVQLTLPLVYYTVRRDPHDERYAWRMFSPMRMAQCAPQMKLDGQPVQLSSTFHEAWFEIASRGRFVVIEAMAAKLCRNNPGKHVEVTVDCSYLDRPSARYSTPDACTQAQLH